VRQAGTLPNKVCAKMGHTAFHAPYNMRTVKSSTNHLVFFRGRGEFLFSGKTMLNLFLTCSELIFKIFAGSLSTGSYRVAKGQHHHLLESLAGFTNYTKYPKGGLNH